MLSIQPLDSAEGAASYYLDVVNYYENDSKSVRWLGEGAKALGIHGQPVEKAQMVALLKGSLPDGTQLGRIDKDGLHHRPGFDMTITAPKSFSILLESGADPRLAGVLDEATEWFVGEMEKEFAQARQVVDGKIEYIDTQNFVIAAFRQPSSRANEPNSHVHLVVQNMTLCPDGKWRSLASDMNGQKGVVEQIMKYHIYGGLKFRNKLANLTKELGHEIVSDGDGFWDIKGVPEEVITRYSTRRAEIEASMKENGLTGAKGASIAAKKTRQDKEIIDFGQWQQDIIRDCLDMEFDPHQLVQRSLSPRSELGLLQTIKAKINELYYGKEAITLNHAREAVHVAIESVSQQEAVFDLRTLKQEALKHTIASHAIVDEKIIDRVIADNIKEQTLYQAMHPYTRKPLLTTPWQLTLECEAIQRIENGKGAVSAICSKQTVMDFIKAKEGEMQFALSPSQKNAMTTFLTSKDRFIAIQGYAGTGKTTMLRLTRELASLHGYEIRGMTAGSSAANELRTKGGLNASTFAKELGWLQKQQHDLSKTIFVVDEASMLSNPQGHKIIKLAEQFNTQLKIIGDKAQLPTPSSGKLFSVVQDYGIETVLMTDNLRQTNAELKESAIHAGRGEIYDAVEKLSHVEARETYVERVEYTANKWLALSTAERNNTLCFAPTHRNRQDITSIMRETLKNEGVLIGHEHYQPILKERNLTSIKMRESVYYAKNDVIRFNNTISRHHIQAGEYLTVGEITTHHKNNKTLPLTRENGKQITFNLASLPKFQTENKDLERPLEVYRKEVLPLMEGDRIQFKRNFESQGIRNSELGRIKAITPNGVHITTDDNITVALLHSAKELQHLDHGYVLTTYASQGKDKKRGLSLIESENRFASNIQNYYVTTTRGVSEMTVVTEDKERLVKAITTDDSDKLSSIEMVTADTLIAHQERFKESKNSITLQNVIEKKLTKEREWQIVENTVERYATAKQQGQAREAAKIAFTIVNEPKTYRLAIERLGFSTNRYRKDAFTLETAKLFNRLSIDERQQFSVVRQYVSLNQQIAKRLEHSKIILPQPKKNIKGTPSSNQEKMVGTNDVHSNRDYLQRLSVKRNALANVITTNLADFKPYLKHFSIGELNRIGLPQHEFGRESAKSQTRLESLACHATLDQIRDHISAYISATGEKREFLAAQIRREAKLSHPFVIEYGRSLNQQSDSLWKSIHQDAREHSDRLFRNGLNADGRHAFDTVKAYKKLQTDIRLNWSESLKQQEENPLLASRDPKSKDLLTLRNELAHQILQNKAAPEVVAHFNLNMPALTQQNQKHQYRENVRVFIASNGNFKARLVAIDNIKADIKGHYPFIKEAGIDTKTISKYMRVTDRVERLDNLTDMEKTDYRLYLAYKRTSHQAREAWQAIHQEKSKGKNNEVIARAMTLSSNRDYLASQLEHSPFLEDILSFERGNKDKLLAHGNNHHVKVQEAASLNSMLQTISKQYLSINSNGSSKEVAAWKSNWASLNQQLKRVEKGRMYQFALKESPISFEIADTIRSELHQSDNHIPDVPLHAQSTSPALKRLQQSSHYIDAKVVNESLMASPEQTYREIWGEPKSQNAKEMRYSGGLIVALKGSNQGLWHDFTEGVGGAPIQAIMKERNVPFQEAIKIASEMAGIRSIDVQFTGIKKDNSKVVEKYKLDDLEKKNKVISAKSIWNSSIGATGTIAEKYLKDHRGIDNIGNLDIRYWPKGAPWKNLNEHGILENKVNKIPALIFAARNEKGELTGVQRIYLDADTAKKNTFMENAKLSKGIMEGSCGVIQKGMRGSKLYIAEGPETAVSIAMADSKSTVLVSYGISNMKNLVSIIKTYNSKDIIIAGDNDASSNKTQQQIEKTIEHYKQNGIDSRSIIPELIDGKKTDWNDVLIKKGVQGIQSQLFGNEVKKIGSKLMELVSIPESVTRMERIKSIGLEGVNRQSLKDISTIIDKDKNLNQLVESYNKTNQQNNMDLIQINKYPDKKISRDVEIEL